MGEKIKKENVLGDLEGVVGSVNSQLDVLSQFMSRRFDELSSEINATSQQINMNDESHVGRLNEVLEILSAISFSGDGKTDVTSGFELEAVIKDTEKAANTILDAAVRVIERIDHVDKWQKPDARKHALEQMKIDVQEILMACTFQDLTGQRIRNTLDNLQFIEQRLSGTLERLGIKIAPDQKKINQKTSDIESVSQDDVDAMFRSINSKD